MELKRSSIVVFATLVALLFTSAFAPLPDEDLVGEWVGTDDATGETISFVFNEDGTAEWEGVPAEADLTWELDATPAPMHLDLVGKNVHTDETMTLAFIVRFLDADELQLRAPSMDPSVRPEAFSESGDAEGELILTRQ